MLDRHAAFGFRTPLQAKALTIARLMEIAPGGTMDPTPFIYDSTMYTMAGMMVRAIGVKVMFFSQGCFVDSVLVRHLVKCKEDLLM